MPFSAILLVFKNSHVFFLQVHNSTDCPYFYGLSVKISDLLHLMQVHHFEIEYCQSII